MRIENSFIPVRGVGEGTERSLWQSGITHWDEFDRDAVSARKADAIEQFIETGYERLDAGDARHFDDIFPSGEQWRIYENFADDVCFFDIETTGLSHHNSVVTTVSFHQNGETTTLVRDDDLTADALSAIFDDAKVIASFNGKRFDVPFLEGSFDVNIDHPHIDLMYTCKKLGLSGGLKQIEKDIGIDRDEPDITGRDAVRLWKEHERGKDGSLDTLVKYNRADTVNLETLMQTATRRLHENVFEAGCNGN
ncbi:MULTISPECIES: ribonuclease H-like domain-containing protein [unclassified Haladaptatus]|uniref:ribonuclease H-like domain-containing protein n=1 Tax=unclassified Haladaptatus TaxID=2622732 RepID=UPI0023E86964|nr:MULTISPECIES: ribonuclease H-like domain-containing protein [unclassified Haladaptatus]